MSSRLPKHLHDALTAATRAVSFLQGLDERAYAENLLVRSAVERQLEILGEASRRAIEDDVGLGGRIPDLSLAIGLRNRIIHGYDRIEHAVVFETVRCDLPPLIERLTVELARFRLE